MKRLLRTFLFVSLGVAVVGVGHSGAALNPGDILVVPLPRGERIQRGRQRHAAEYSHVDPIVIEHRPKRIFVARIPHDRRQVEGVVNVDNRVEPGGLECPL